MADGKLKYRSRKKDYDRYQGYTAASHGITDSQQLPESSREGIRKVYAQSPTLLRPWFQMSDLVKWIQLCCLKPLKFWLFVFIAAALRNQSVTFQQRYNEGKGINTSRHILHGKNNLYRAKSYFKALK